MSGVRSRAEDHEQKCLLGYQFRAAEWQVRRCEHGRIQRWQPVGRGAWFWRDLSRLEHPILWLRATREADMPTTTDTSPSDGAREGGRHG